MKVLQITAFSGWGCTGRISVGISNALTKEGYDNYIAWGRTNTAPSSVKTIQIGNSLDQKLHGLYTRLTDRCGFGSKRCTKEFIKELKLLKPDLIQLHIMHGYYINLEVLFTEIKKMNTPVVWTFHDCWAFTGHCPYFDLVRCEKWKTGCHDCEQKLHHPTSWILDNSARNWQEKKELFTGIENLTVVTPSHWLKSLVEQSFLKNADVRVINNGIDLSVFKPTESNFRKRYHLENKTVLLGVSSTWVKSKGVEDFRYLAERLPADYQIVMVGLTAGQIKELPKKIIGIERTDSVQELAEIYSAADVFVNPTYEDNFPTTNIEALACGTPVITYETGGSVEAAGNEFGCIVPQGDMPALLECALSDSWKCDRNLCVAHAQNFDANKKYDEYVALYRGIING